MALLSASNITKNYFAYEGLFNRSQTVIGALKSVSISIEKGDSLGIVGQSGSGKTTLARVLAGLVPPNSGELFYKDTKISNPKKNKEYRRNVQMVFQHPDTSLNPKLTIYSALYDLLLFKYRKESIRGEAEKLLAKVGLFPEHLDRYPHELSGGQKQRVSIARAISLNPEVIIADEPVSNLDVSVQAQIINLFAELKRNCSLAFIFISHDLAVVNKLCQKIAVMKDGCIVEKDSAKNLLTAPKHEYTKQLLSI